MDLYDNIHSHAQEQKFYSIDGKHLINTYVLDDVAWFEPLTIDVTNGKTLCLLIKTICKHFKSQNVKYVKQYVMDNDVGFFEKSTVVKMDDYSIVTTCLEDFPVEVSNAFGLSRL